MSVFERVFRRQGKPDASVEQTKPTPPDLLPAAELTQTTKILLRDLQLRLSNTPELRDPVVRRWLGMVPDGRVLEKDKRVSFKRGGFLYLVENHLNSPTFTSITVYRVPENEALSMFNKEMISVSSGWNSPGSMTYLHMNASTNELHQKTKTAEVRIRQFMEDFPQSAEQMSPLEV